MGRGGRVAPAGGVVTLLLLLLLLVAHVAEGGGSSRDQHDCQQLCEVQLKKNATETLGKVAACEEGCTTISQCLHPQHTLRGSGAAIEMSESCLMSCEIFCERRYGTKPNLRPACVGGCNVQHRQEDNLVTIADAQYLSQRMEILEDAGPGIGIKEDKTHNISLNLGGKIQTNIKSQAFVGPNLERDDISTKGAKRIEDKSIKFDLTGEIGNDTTSEATLSKHGKGAGMSYGKRGRESSENTSLNIQGVVSHNGSYIDVSSKYEPVSEKMVRAAAGRKKKKIKRKKKKGSRRRKKRRRRRRRPRRYKVKKKQESKLADRKPADRKPKKIIPKEVQKLVKAPVTK